MKAYEGRGEELLQQLKEKYEPKAASFQDCNNENSNALSANKHRPTSPAAARNAAVKLCKEQNKNKVGDMLSSANDNSVCFGNCLEDEALPVQLTSEQQEEALDKRIELLQFVLTFYSHYNAKNIANVDQIV